MRSRSDPLLEELVAFVWPRGGLEQAAGASSEVGEIDAAALGLLREALGEVERVVEERPAEGGVLAHVGEDGAFGARGDDRLGDAFDPDERAPSVAPALVADGLDRVDLVGARVLAEAEE